jgi:hypothetical protein
VQWRRYFVGLLFCTFLPPLLLVALVVGVDPYYLFGSPSLPGINMVRPHYEMHSLAVKPYQVRRLRPAAVALGSSRVEVGLDPQHPGWADRPVFNFAMSSNSSLDVMLTFLHAQAVGRPLKQAVVGLDFFAFNINQWAFAGVRLENALQFAGGAARQFIEFETPILAERRAQGRVRPPPPSVNAPGWDEKLYLAVNADVAAVVGRMFESGRDHYQRAGQAERRRGATVPPDWDESGYLEAHPDVAAAIKRGTFISGYHHYLAAGQAEERLGGFALPDWNEARYLAVNPDAALQVALGRYRTGYIHYASVGRTRGLLGGLPPPPPIAWLRVRWPVVNEAIFAFQDYARMIFSVTALQESITTVLRQGEPASFDAHGMRVWHGHDDHVRRYGGAGQAIRRLPSRGLNLWLPPPQRTYCLTNPATGMSMLDPFRFMVRRAYETDTDLKLFITPLHASIRTNFDAAGLTGSYQFWLRELVRINEQEAKRANRPPLQLWDFNDVNSITSERVPAMGDLTPMQWYWEHSHYRQSVGDLILDRLFGVTHSERKLPADFGKLLTGATIESHLKDSALGLAVWERANSELADSFRAMIADQPELFRQAEATCDLEEMGRLGPAR